MGTLSVTVEVKKRPISYTYCDEGAIKRCRKGEKSQLCEVKSNGGDDVVQCLIQRVNEANLPRKGTLVGSCSG